MNDLISRQQAVDVIRAMQTYKLFAGDDLILVDKAGVMTELMMLPSAQPVATDTNVGDTISRKGVFIPNITVEMFRNASLEGVEDLMASGEMEDISLPSAQPEITRCRDCKYRDEKWRMTSVRWLPCMDVRTGGNWYCGSAERGEQDG